MQKRCVWSTTIAYGVLLLLGCGRHGSPTAPAQSTSGAAVQTIQIGGDALSGPFVVGRTMQLKATARMLDGSERDITSFASWASDNPDVASVSSSGLVTARNRGSGRVRASYLNSTGETTFNVVESAEPPSSSPPGSTPGAPGGGSPGNGSPGDGSSQPPPSGPGTGCSAGNPPAPGAPPTVNHLTIHGDPTVPVGKSSQYRAIAHMSDCSERDVTSDTDWRSDNTLVGSISQSGLFMGLTPGSNVVTGRYDGAQASQPVKVTPL